LSGRIINELQATITGVTSAYVVVASTTGFYEKAFCTLAANGQPGVLVKILKVQSATQLRVRLISSPRGNDMISYPTETRLNYNTPMGTMTGTVTGGTSAATGVVVSDSGTYFVLRTLNGVFLDTETLAFGGGGTAVASGSQYVSVDTAGAPAGPSNIIAQDNNYGY